MRKAQLDAAWGKVFEAPGVINGSAKVRFMGIWPSGNVAVKRGSDPDSFGPLTKMRRGADFASRSISLR